VAFVSDRLLALLFELRVEGEVFAELLVVHGLFKLAQLGEDLFAVLKFGCLPLCELLLDPLEHWYYLYLATMS